MPERDLWSISRPGLRNPAFPLRRPRKGPTDSKTMGLGEKRARFPALFSSWRPPISALPRHEGFECARQRSSPWPYGSHPLLCWHPLISGLRPTFPQKARASCSGLRARRPLNSREYSRSRSGRRPGYFRALRDLRASSSRYSNLHCLNFYPAGTAGTRRRLGRSRAPHPCPNPRQPYSSDSDSSASPGRIAIGAIARGPSQSTELSTTATPTGMSLSRAGLPAPPRPECHRALFRGDRRARQFRTP
jgi:hypothetical protein